MRRIFANPLALAGFFIIATVLLLALLAPFIAPFDPDAIDVKAILLSPSSQHLMGTDGLGRDVFSRMLFGARISLLVGIVVRAEFLSLRGREFVMASQTLGARDGRLIFRHLLPNSLTPIIVSSVLGVASAVLIESGLSFLGLGVQAPQASWGNILTDGKEYIQFAWWLSLFPGLAILITVLGYNLLGEGLRDALDPRTTNK